MYLPAKHMLWLVVGCVAVAIVLAHTHTATNTAEEEQMPCTCPMRYLQQSYKQPQQTLQTSSTCAFTVTSHFKHQFACIVSDQSIRNSEKHKDLQLLCAAFLLRMLALRTITMDSQCTMCMRALKRVHAAEMACATAAEEASRLRERVDKAESIASLLNQKLVQHKEAIMQLQSSKNTLCEQVKALQLRSKCAPKYFDLLIEFIKVKCVTGTQMKVGSAELHQAFEKFLSHAQKSQQTTLVAPTQRELRALMETLGFEYAQVYHHGANTRCLKGIQLRV